jgi:aminomethyltransferase
MDAYHAAHNGAVLVDLKQRGRISLQDRDRVDLVNRMSTNDLTQLAEGEGVATVLTTPIGRIIDVLVFLNAGEESLVITGEGRGQIILDYLRRNLFFNDRVQITNQSASTRLLGVYGVDAAQIVSDWGIEADELSEYNFIAFDDARIIHAEPLASRGFWILCDEASTEKWKSRALDAGAVEADAETYELLSIEAGYPLTSHELTADYIPLEAGLWHSVSFNKGCYTGQEVIARMESRGKLAKMLVRLAVDNVMAEGTALFDNEKKVGTLTSLRQRPDGGYLGLGYVNAPSVSEKNVLHGENGTRLKILGIAGTQPER